MPGIFDCLNQCFGFLKGPLIISAPFIPLGNNVPSIGELQFSHSLAVLRIQSSYADKVA